MRRVRRGRGFSYEDEHGNPIKAPKVLDRIRELAVPPAWEDVWLCPDPLGHLQATGIDAAGRRQYLYHSRWRERRDREKFERMLAFAELLPRLRKRLVRVLDEDDDGLTRDRVLAAAVRLLDVGMFRVGSEQYAAEDSGVGLATVRKEHVHVHADAVEFDYPGKGGTRRLQVIEDPVTIDLINTPAVARRAYIDPRVFDRYLSGWTIAGAVARIGDLDVADDRVRTRVERAVVDLLVENVESNRLEHAEAA